MEKATTIAQLRQSEYRVLPVKEEMRKNLVRKIKASDVLFPGIIGYDGSVIPQVENAILSGQDVVFLGERGQAKSRLIRSLVSLLDEQVPVIDGCEINDNPYVPICRACRDRVAAQADRVAVRWISPDEPEDYTDRGRIITPLKDRFGAQIRTHYPRSVEDEIRIVEQERTDFQDRELTVIMPDYMKEIVAEVTQLARRSPKVNQRSGVSVRISITNYENLASNASRRALRTGETEAVPRISDLPSIIPSSAGKLEMETWEEGDDQTVLEKIIKTAVLNVFRRHFESSQFTELVQRFDAGLTFEVSEGQPAERYMALLRELPGMEKALKGLGLDKRPALAASGVEFVLEGLHLSKRINKTELDGGAIYAG